MKINNKGYIEAEIGEKFNLLEIYKKVIVLNNDVNKLNCSECVFYEEDCCIIPCFCGDRDDETNVIFKELKDE